MNDMEHKDRHNEQMKWRSAWIEVIIYLALHTQRECPKPVEIQRASHPSSIHPYSEPPSRREN
jgi:hypothetical protein